MNRTDAAACDGPAQIEPLGGDALLVRLGAGVDLDCNRRVHALAEQLRNSLPAGVGEIVPAYSSLAVLFDDSAAAGAHRQRILEWLRAAVAAAVAHEPAATPTRSVEIPVRYGGDAGPDLAAVAAHAGLHPDEVVARHAGGEYQVAMIGFAAGFPYLLGMDPALAMPRLETPRTRVPAGSVAIADAQTGIYPQHGPGGWRLIGRTDAVLFCAERAPPTLVQAGDRVRLRAL